LEILLLRPDRPLCPADARLCIRELRFRMRTPFAAFAVVAAAMLPLAPALLVVAAASQSGDRLWLPGIPRRHPHDLVGFASNRARCNCDFDFRAALRAGPKRPPCDVRPSPTDPGGLRCMEHNLTKTGVSIGVGSGPQIGVGPFRWTSVGLAIDRQAGLSREESPWQSTDPIASNLSVTSRRSFLLARHCTVWRSATTLCADGKRMVCGSEASCLSLNELP
jgi:hypothetical protein